MRTVQVLTQAGGGPADHAVDVAVELARRGHDSHLVAPRRPDLTRVEAAGVTWHADTMLRRRDLGGLAALVGRLDRLRPDVVHLHDRRAGWVGRAWAGARGRPGGRPGRGGRAGGAVVATLHGAPDGLADLVEGGVRAAPRRPHDRLAYLAAERWLTRWAGARVVSPSHAYARYAVRHLGLPAARVDVVRHGVDPHRFAPVDDGGGPVDGSRAPTALFLGALEPVKRVEVLLDALAVVPTAVRLVVVGDGPLRSALAARAAGSDLAGRVELRGAVDDPRPSLRQADLVVLPSAAENCPLALLQAMACARPVLATAVGGVPEVVRDGVEGWLVPPDDRSALTVALARALDADDADTRDARGRAARARVLSGWTLEAGVDGLLRTYRRAVEDR